MSGHRQAVHLNYMRHQQLAALATHHGHQHITEYVDSLIVREAEAAGIATDPEGFEIVPVQKGDGAPLVIVGGTLLPLVHLRPDEARRLADQIDTTLEHGHTTAIETGEDRDLVEFARHGRGCILRVREAMHRGQVHKRGMTVSIARDLARALRRAADKAEASEA